MRRLIFSCLLLLPCSGLLRAQDFYSFTLYQQLVPYRKGTKWGYADKNRTIVIEPRFEAAGLFNPNLAPVKKKGKYGCINEQGKFIIPPRYDALSVIGDNDFSVLKNGKRWCIDAREKPKECPFLDAVFSREKGFDFYKDQEKYGFIVTIRDYGRIWIDTFPAEYDTLIDLGYLAIGSKSGKWGAINYLGKEILPFEWDDIQNNPFPYYGNKFCRIIRNGLIGYMSEKGDIVIPPKYEKAEFFFKGLALVKPPGRDWGYIDDHGRAFFEEDK